MKDSAALELIGAEHRDRIVRAYETMTANGAGPDEITRVLSDMLVQSNGAAGVDGAALARRQLEDLGIDVAPDYFDPLTSRSARNDAIQRAMADRERFGTAVGTILDGDPESIAMRLGRLALSEAIEAARGTTATYMRGSRKVDGWIRELDSDPCQLCQWWHRDGRVWPADHTMPVHKGCACAQRWVRRSAASVRMVGEQGEAQSAERLAAGTLEERRGMNVGDYSSRSVRGTSDDS